MVAGLLIWMFWIILLEILENNYNKKGLREASKPLKLVAGTGCEPATSLFLLSKMSIFIKHSDSERCEKLNWDKKSARLDLICYED